MRPLFFFSLCFASVHTPRVRPGWSIAAPREPQRLQLWPSASAARGVGVLSGWAVMGSVVAVRQRRHGVRLRRGRARALSSSPSCPKPTAYFARVSAQCVPATKHRRGSIAVTEETRMHWSSYASAGAHGGAWPHSVAVFIAAIPHRHRGGVSRDSPGAGDRHSTASAAGDSGGAAGGTYGRRGTNCSGASTARGGAGAPARACNSDGDGKEVERLAAVAPPATQPPPPPPAAVEAAALPARGAAAATTRELECSGGSDTGGRERRGGSSGDGKTAVSADGGVPAALWYPPESGGGPAGSGEGHARAGGHAAAARGGGGKGTGPPDGAGEPPPAVRPNAPAPRSL